MIYLCTLTPIDPFFFGGETTFGDDGANYYAQSNQMPQQTTLLGMLRYSLFMHMKQQGKSKEEILENVIGKKSFVANENSSDGFGFIKQLSPVFLKSEKEHFFPAPLFLNHEQQPIRVNENKVAQVFMGTSDWQPACLTSSYEAKKGLSDDHFVSSQKRVCPAEDLFKPITKVGITKERDGSSKERGFYKQKLYQLQQVKFAFFVQLEVPSEFKFDPVSLDKSIVTLGGEQASFVLHISTYDSSTACDEAFRKEAIKAYQSQNPSDKLEKIVLTSDVCITTDIYRYCRFAITQTAHFRNIVTPENAYKNNDFASLSTHENKQEEKKQTLPGRYKSAKFNLLRRGSVLYPKENSADIIAQELKEQQHFYQIGYNHFIKLPNS